MEKPTIRFIQIDADQSGRRIDNFLMSVLKPIPRSLVYRLLRTGQVRINGRRCKPDYRLQSDDQVRIPPVSESDLPTKQTRYPQHIVQTLKKAIIHEDADLLIIDKPSGLAVHKGSGLNYGIIELMRHIHPNLPKLELVHRLDRETSGCLMLAKNSSTLRRLHLALQNNRIHKQYLALVMGQWPDHCHTINQPLRKIQQGGERMMTVSPQGNPSRTQFRRLDGFHHCSLINASPITGRTHQIRVHAAFTGHPLAGDDKYGDRQFNNDMKKAGLKRLFLHAASITLEQPKLAVHAPLPKLLKNVLTSLKTQNDEKSNTSGKFFPKNGLGDRE